MLRNNEEKADDIIETSKYLNWHLTGEIQMTNTHIKRHPTSLLTKEMKTRATVCYFPPATTWTNIFSLVIARVGKDVE